MPLAAGAGTFIAAVLTVLSLTKIEVLAADFQWNGGTIDIASSGNGASDGGAGAWNTTLLNWDGDASPLVVWNNAGSDIAVFGGRTVGTVALGRAITVGGFSV